MDSFCCVFVCWTGSIPTLLFTALVDDSTASFFPLLYFSALRYSTHIETSHKMHTNGRLYRVCVYVCVRASHPFALSSAQHNYYDKATEYINTNSTNSVSREYFFLSLPCFFVVNSFKIQVNGLREKKIWAKIILHHTIVWIYKRKSSWCCPFIQKFTSYRKNSIEWIETKWN